MTQSPQTNAKGFSKAFWVSNTVELFERMAYYAVFIVLTIYLSNILGFNDFEASMISGLFSGGLYLLPIFTGAYADKIGFRKSMIIAFSLLSAGYLGLGVLPTLLEAAGLVEYYCYDGAPKSCYFNNIVNEIYLGAGAELNHYKFQNEACKAAHIAFNAVRIKRNGVYNGFCLQKGADLGRNETRVQLLEEEAKAEVNAAYLMNGWATLDTTTDIEHLAEKTYSSQLIKGVVGGEAKGVFQGKIRIAPNAQKTEGRQLHKALLLSDTAEIDVKPELEIYADDVKCSHGAASGELDREQLFYLRSRGIGEEEARQMLIDAYLTDVVARVDDPEIRDWLRGQI